MNIGVPLVATGFLMTHKNVSAKLGTESYEIDADGNL